MKRRGLILFGLLILFSISYLSYLQFTAPFGIEIFENGKVYYYQANDGSFEEIITDMVKDEVNEAIFLNPRNEAVIIEAVHLHNFGIRRNFRNWDLIDLEKNQKVITTTRVLLKSNTGTLGVNHLRKMDDFACYSLYDLIKDSIECPDQENFTYRKGMFRSQDDLLTFQTNGDSVLLIYSTGEEIWLKKNESGEISIGLEEIFGKRRMDRKQKTLKGIWEDPPEISSWDIYTEQITSLEEQPLMAIFIDGLGYKLWQYAQEKDYTKTFPELQIEPSRAVYPPKTIYNYYAFGTGELLFGDRRVRNEIFARFLEDNKRGVILEGEMQVYSSPVPQILHPRSSSSENIDTKIYHTAMEILNDYEFIFIHFQDVDNNGHHYGPYSSEVMKAIERTGEYISELTGNWKGDILIFSDHGMHQYYDQETGNIGGTHYAIRAEDMIGVFSRLNKTKKEGGVDEE